MNTSESPRTGEKKLKDVLNNLNMLDDNDQVDITQINQYIDNYENNKNHERAVDMAMAEGDMAWEVLLKAADSVAGGEGMAIKKSLGAAIKACIEGKDNDIYIFKVADNLYSQYINAIININTDKNMLNMFSRDLEIILVDAARLILINLKESGVTNNNEIFTSIYLHITMNHNGGSKRKKKSKKIKSYIKKKKNTKNTKNTEKTKKTKKIKKTNKKR